MSKLQTLVNFILFNPNFLWLQSVILVRVIVIANSRLGYLVPFLHCNLLADAFLTHAFVVLSEMHPLDDLSGTLDLLYLGCIVVDSWVIEFNCLNLVQDRVI